MIRTLFIVLSLSCWIFSFGQDAPGKDSLKSTEFPLRTNGIKLDQYITDTLQLGAFTAKKVIAYKYQAVTFFVNYKDYLTSIKVFWRRYKGRLKYGGAGDARWLLIDSVYQAIRKLSRKQDTIYLSQKVFDNVGLRSLMDFDVQIEKGNCAIYSSDNILQKTIIRQKGHWYRGPLASWGGRRYFLIGDSNFFYQATDWIS